MELNQLKISHMNDLISQTEKKMNQFFSNSIKTKTPLKNDSVSPLKNFNSPLTSHISPKKNTNNKISIKQQKNKIENYHSPSKEIHLKIKPKKCRKLKNPKKEENEDNYEKFINKLERKKMHVLNELANLEKNQGKNERIPKTNLNSDLKPWEKKFLYEISVLKAALMNEKENNKKLSCELAKYKNRYKLNHFH